MPPPVMPLRPELFVTLLGPEPKPLGSTVPGPATPPAVVRVDDAGAEAVEELLPVELQALTKQVRARSAAKEKKDFMFAADSARGAAPGLLAVESRAFFS